MALTRIKRIVFVIIVSGLALHALLMIYLNRDFRFQSVVFNKRILNNNGNVEHGGHVYLTYTTSRNSLTYPHEHVTDTVEFVSGNEAWKKLKNGGYFASRKKDPVQLSNGNIQVADNDYLQQAPFEFSSDFKNPCWLSSGTLRCLPYMYVIGVKKCGTTNLFAEMMLHPDFVFPGFKEAQWFARRRFNTEKTKNDSIAGYVEMFDKAAQRIRMFSTKQQNGRISNHVQITGEGSPSNLHLNSHWKSLPGNENLTEPKVVILDYIKHFTPRAKIIIIFRNPIDRLYSDYYHEYGFLRRSKSASPNHFHFVVQRGIELYKDCFRKRSLRSCVYEPSIYDQIKIQMQLGIYHIFWEELLRLFPRDQILVLQNKDMHNMTNMLTTAFDFLDVRKLTSEQMNQLLNRNQRGNTRGAEYSKKGLMFNMTRKLLNDFYEPFNKKMAAITGDTTFLYNDES